ncbi:hypothetical protein ABPG72_004636 [Tetrahymena utriculariae]
MKTRHFDIVLAQTLKKQGIGYKNSLPWRLPNELKNFKKITTETKNKGLQNSVIMGKNTWEALPKKQQPLKDRLNIVISTTMQEGQIADHSYACKSFDSALTFLEQQNQIQDALVIGGAKLCQQALNDHRLRQIHLTRLGVEVECDVFMQKDYLKNFDLVEVSETQSENNLNYDFTRYFNKNYKGQVDSSVFKKMYKPHQEYQYLELIDEIIKNGHVKNDRTGTGTISQFGKLMRFDLSKSFPLLTTKNVFWRGVLEELIWFIKGSTNSKILSEKGVKIWDGNGSREFLDQLGFKSREEGDLGPVYGFQWRHFGAEYKDMHTNYKDQGVDQLQHLINTIKTNPDSRRMIMNAWNVKDLPLMALPPCHVMSQFYVNDNKLSCMMYQRSCDMGLGIPFNIASYALLTHMIAQVTNMQVGEFIHVLGDAHVYSNHVDQLKIQLQRAPYPFPLLKINNNKQYNSIEDFTLEDFELIGYNYHPKIQMKMAV